MARSDQARSGAGTVVRRLLLGSLWPVPAVSIVGAIALATVLPHVDAALQRSSGEPLELVFGGGPGAARAVLSAIATSLITATTLLFSLTIVTLQLASSQYSPRLLQTFVRDRVVQGCLAVLLGTFVYALAVLRGIRSADSRAPEFVPRIAVTVAFVLTLLSVGALVAFLSHQVRQLRVETMMRDVHDEAKRTVRSLEELPTVPGRPQHLPPVPAHASPVVAAKSGFLTTVHEQRLVRRLVELDAVVRLDRRPGDPVISGVPAAWAWTRDAEDQLDVDGVTDAVREALVVHYEREDGAGPSNGMRTLVDVAVRALSPGTNDPTTAVHALSHVSALLGDSAVHDVGHRLLCDDDGQLRLAAPSWSFPALLDLAVTQVRHYGRDECAVVARLFRLLAEVAWRSRTPEQRLVLTGQLECFVEEWGHDPPPGRTVEDVREWADAVERALAGRWPPSTNG